VSINLKALAKRLYSSEPVRKFACWLAAKYITLVRRTGRWEVIGWETPERALAEKRPLIVAFWHSRLLMMPYTWLSRTPFNMLISEHRDGRIISDIVAHFGIRTIAGSKTRGGLQALRLMVKTLKNGEVVGITPDGPKGPRMRDSSGAASLAKLSGAIVVPLAYSASRRKIFGTWDRFLLPIPFSRGVFLWGQPVEVPRDADEATMEAARQAIEDGLNAVTAEADARCGHPIPIEPGPPWKGEAK
jgi:lysophospholipid acyltransferase (LPLAT)-like uncharacterized protein